MARPLLTVSTLHAVILRHLVERGCAPSSEALAAQFGVTGAELRSVLEALRDDHGVVLHPHQPEVWVAHPFATAPTPFAVRKGDRMWWGNCAWCSLGIAALLGGDGVTIETTLGAEGQPVKVHVDGGRVREDLWIHFPVPMARAWDNVIYTCSTMLVFQTQDAIDGWSERHAIPRGDARPIQQAYEFAAVWYGRHLDDDWRKWTVAQAREMFRRLGLDGPIWQLAEAADRF